MSLHQHQCIKALCKHRRMQAVADVYGNPTGKADGRG